MTSTHEIVLLHQIFVSLNYETSVISDIGKPIGYWTTEIHLHRNWYLESVSGAIKQFDANKV